MLKKISTEHPSSLPMLVIFQFPHIFNGCQTLRDLFRMKMRWKKCICAANASILAASKVRRHLPVEAGPHSRESSLR